MLTDHVLAVAPDVVSAAQFCAQTCPGGWPGDRPCHRYLLRRTWNPGGPVLAVIGKNPSAADEAFDSVTMRRVCLLARRRGFGAVLMLNAYGLRATDPHVLARSTNPIGPNNDSVIVDHVGTGDLVLAAWGCIATKRDRALRAILRSAVVDPARVVCFGLTKQGFPKHPLYQSADPTLAPFPVEDKAAC